jgi:hypothetical protein
MAVDETDAGAAAPPSSFWQIGLVVPDVRASMAELTAALGIEWREVVTRHVGEWQLEVVFSKQGPPYLELIRGETGGPWDPDTHPGLDHFGYWVDDLPTERRRLEDGGFPISVDGEAVGRLFNYHTVPNTRMRLEPIDLRYQDSIREAFGLEDV